jgi:Flp pilus assembly protein TadB
VVDAPHHSGRERVVIGALALAWGAIAAFPGLFWARRVHVGERLGRPTPRLDAARRRMRAAAVRVGNVAPIAMTVRVLSAPRRRRTRRRRDDVIARELGAAVDLIGVGVAAGCTPYVAVDLGARWSPPLVAGALRDALSGCALGQTFDDAMRDLGARLPGMRALTDALRTSTRLGSPVAPALARVSRELRADLRRRAEARARTVPVRLCFPLVGCILPAFALLTVAPVVLGGLRR